MMQRGIWTSLLGLSTLMGSACDGTSSGGGSGRLRVLLAAEASITDGLDQGSEVEDTQDYDVRFSKYLIAVGGVRLGKSSSGARASLAATYIADLRQVGEQGLMLGVIEDLEAGQWDEFGYDTPRAGKGVKGVGDVDPADVAKMASEGLTYWIEGKVMRPVSQGGPVSFVIQTDAHAEFSNCELDGEPGVSVVADGTSTATLTIHGDHMFFNSFPTGTEGNIERKAGWVIQADSDMDGKVTTEELLALDASEVFTSTAGYSLDGKPKGLDIDNALDFVRAQLTTQGHLNGEGECLSRYVPQQD